jgi:hypothetical protein
MLEPLSTNDDAGDAVEADSADNDWEYRPDDQLERELERMRRFTADLGTIPYRLNNDPFYLKL